jgi:hypothetical protein
LRIFFGYIVISFSALLAAQASASCGSAFCMLNTNWSAQGVWAEAGARLDVRYETIDQNQLLQGKKSADATEENHREQNTLNKNLQTTMDYAFNETYGITINVPLVSREHTHFQVDAALHEKEVWSFSNLGDVRVIGRIQLSPLTSLHDAYGINFGVKLPTGDYQVANSNGETAERSLQPGTGTTDAIVGAYFRQQLPNMNAQWFTQVSFVSPMNKRDEFKTGKQFTADIGYLYKATKVLHVMAQVNYSHKGRDEGVQAEPENSGGTALFFSPGLSYAFKGSIQVYSFLHHRLSQEVNGEQLSAKNSFVVGMSTRF